MRIIGCDFETHLITRGCIAPRLVCGSWNDGEQEGLLDREQTIAFCRAMLEDPDVIWVNHYIAFDLGVLCAEDSSLLPLVFRAIDEGRIRCTKLREQMIQNALGQLKYYQDDLGEMRAQDFSLQALVKKYFDKWLQKGGDTWRLRYNELDGVPLEQWPPEAVKYPLDDARWTRAIYVAQEAMVLPDGIPGEIATMQAQWALYLMSLWGMRTDAVAVEKLRVDLTAEFEDLREKLITCELVRAKDGSRNMKAIRALVEECWAKEFGDVSLPRTDGGAVSTSRDTLMKCADERLTNVAEMVKTGKVLQTYVPALLAGSVFRVNPSYNPILETFRTSCSKPNIQQFPRKGDTRGCVVPGRYKVLVSCDYDTLELRSLAQVCLDFFGYSRMADVLRQDRDLHLAFAADMLGIPYEEALVRYKAGDKEVEEARQTSKVADFGYPGGMSAKTFREYARTAYGMLMSQEQADALHAGFRKNWPEMVDYFEMGKGMVGGDCCERQVFSRSGMVRGRVRYTAWLNGNFQHLAAVGAKAAAYAVAKECYTVPTSPLFGCRPVAFIHDEILLEAPYDEQDPSGASAAADRLSEVMVIEMSKWITDVPVKASAVMMRRWRKGAKPVRRDGMLVPSKAQKTATGSIWVEDTDPLT